MRLCNEKITVFCSRLDTVSDTDQYTATVIDGVSWFYGTKANVTSSGLKAANTVTIRIPADANFSGKTYVDPTAYPSGDPMKVFTLKNGDVIVKGDASRVVNPRPATLQKAYYEMVTILGVTDNRRAKASHWKVTGA